MIGVENRIEIVDSLVEKVARDPSICLQANDQVAELARKAVKAIFDYSSETSANHHTLSELYVDGFDTEQIWLQIELQLSPFVKKARKLIRIVGEEASLIPEEVEEALEELLGGEDSPESNDEEDHSLSDITDSELSEEEAGSKEEDEDDISSVDELPEPSSMHIRSEIEDEHFRLDDMEAFLKEAELEMEGNESEEDFDDDALDPGEGPSGSDSEAELDALLENRSHKSDKKRRKLRSSEFEGEEDEEDEDDYANARYEDFFGPVSALAPLKRRKNEGDSRDAMDEQGDEPPSRYQNKLISLAHKIRALEEEALSDKHWSLKGEISATGRPKNSALELDLDFETTVKPPPPPSEEATKDLEVLIKRRINDEHWDDVIKVVPAPVESKRKILEFDDRKSAHGLGELYEKDYVAAVTGTVDDKDAPVREVAKSQFAALSAKLDRLSHLYFAPKQSLDDVAVKVDAPAILMEEATPAFVSEAALMKPEEVHTGAKAGQPKAKEELTREERSAKRASKKRSRKNKKAVSDAAKAVREVYAGGETRIAGRKSEAMKQEIQKMKLAEKKVGRSKTNYSRSTSVFSKLAAMQQAGQASTKAQDDVPATQLKL